MHLEVPLDFSAPGWLTVNEAANRLGLKNPKTLYNWLCAKRYPKLRKYPRGRNIFFRVENVEEVIGDMLNRETT